MPKRAAEGPPTSELQGVRPAGSFGYYRSQVAEFLSQEERISLLRDQEATVSHFDSAIGAGMSDPKKECLNALLRQCVRNLTPEVDEMQRRVCQMYIFSQMANKFPSASSSFLQSLIPEESRGAIEDDVQFLLSNPDLLERLTSQYSSVLLPELDNMQQQLENLLDDVVTACRPMRRGEKRDLQKSIKELPERNLHRIAEIVEHHCITSGKDVSDEVIINLDQSDDIMLWRLHFYVGAVKKAQKLAR